MILASSFRSSRIADNNKADKSSRSESHDFGRRPKSIRAKLVTHVFQVAVDQRIEPSLDVTSSLAAVGRSSSARPSAS